MFPILLYLPPALGFSSITVKHITGLTMIQGFFSSLSAMLFYHRRRLVDKGLVFSLGISLFASSLAGSLFSKYVPDNILLFIFGLLAMTAAVMMFVPRSYAKDELTAGEIGFNRPLAIIIGIGVGFLVGMVGQGGAFIVIPMLLYVLKIPLRVALGSTLAIGLFSASAGLAGKIATGQVPFAMSAAMLAGAVPVAKLGGIVSRKTKTHHLRWLLAFLISVSAIKVWADIFLPGH